MKVLLSKILAPISNALRETDVAQTWEVRWYSRQGQYSSDVQPECEVFISEAEALHFKVALEQAFRLIRHTSGALVTISKRGAA